jgi:hypothetical protein
MSWCLHVHLGVVVCVFVSGDARVSQDPVNFSCNAVGKEIPSSPIDPPH